MGFHDCAAARRIPPPEDILVWDLAIPPAAVGTVMAICDGYENVVQLRSLQKGGPGDFAAWIAPAFATLGAALLTCLAERYDINLSGPRPFDPADLRRGMHLKEPNAGDE